MFPGPRFRMFRELCFLLGFIDDISRNHTFYLSAQPTSDHIACAAVSPLKSLISLQLSIKLLLEPLWGPSADQMAPKSSKWSPEGA